jgi:hypothetical protein
MKIEIRFLGLEPSEMLREHCERQALFHLSRFGHDLSSVDIRIRDVNNARCSPRGLALDTPLCRN